MRRHKGESGKGKKTGRQRQRETERVIARESSERRERDTMERMWTERRSEEDKKGKRKVSGLNPRNRDPIG